MRQVAKCQCARWPNSLRPYNTIVVLEEYAKTINSIIKLSDDILPKYNLYIRSDFNKILKELYTYADDSSWNKKDKN